MRLPSLVCDHFRIKSFTQFPVRRGDLVLALRARSRAKQPKPLGFTAGPVLDLEMGDRKGRPYVALSWPETPGSE